LGVFHEQILADEVFDRMGGLAHPNTLGQICGLALLFLVFGPHRIWARSRPLFYFLLAASAGALILSVSRTSLAACLLALLWTGRSQILAIARAWRLDLLAITFLMGLMLLGAGLLGDQASRGFAQKISKSGDSAELTSFTGRSVIWAQAIRLTGERPLLGYGAGTSKILLKDYSYHSHNMILNVALSAGFVAASFLLGALLWYGLQSLGRPVELPDAIFAILVLNGLMETVIFSVVAGVPTAVLVLALAWRSTSNLFGQSGSPKGVSA
jgi:O-antigen ligase